jgi:hypothetical protein
MAHEAAREAESFLVAAGVAQSVDVLVRLLAPAPPERVRRPMMYRSRSTRAVPDGRVGECYLSWRCSLPTPNVTGRKMFAASRC